MKPWQWVLIVLACIGGLSMCSSYNSALNSDQAVESKIGDLNAAYQRRADLIPNLVKTIKASGAFEEKVLLGVTEARASAGKLTLSAETLNSPDAMKKFQEAQAQLQGSLSRLLATAENYPQLQTTAAYRDLIAQLEGTENRIQTERHKLNETIKAYNQTVLGFPNVLFTNMFGYHKRNGFTELTPGTDRAVNVDFGSK